jgi:hypothetical protein
VRLRYAAVTFVGCTEPEAVRRPASRMGIIGTCAHKRGDLAVALGPEILRVRPETSRWIAEFSEHEADLRRGARTRAPFG